MTLPTDIIKGASLRGKEYGWTIFSFPEALKSAAAHGYACLGGQFQFRMADGGTCEMYWLGADSSDRYDGETWTEYSHRSCAEVLANFRKQIEQADFTKEARNWNLSINTERDLVFVAYFVRENDVAENSPQSVR